MLRFDDCDGSVSVFRQPSNNSNGNAVDCEGRLITCEHLSRRVTRTEHNGAMIAEVSLDDDMKFGVRWFLGQNNNNAGFSDAANGAVSKVFPGFSYFMKENDIAFSLNAISSVTNVRVLSAPSMVVLDNKQATLQVGDQVPIVTQSAKGTASGDAPIVSNIELKDTGVILKITPRVNDSGVVTLDIEQEVSSVVKTTNS